MTESDFLEACKEAASHLLARHGDIIPPMVLTINKDGEREVVVYSGDGSMTGSKMAALAAMEAIKRGALMIAIVATTWSVVIKPDKRWAGGPLPKDVIPPSQHPDRVENGLISLHTPDGDKIYRSPIDRSGDFPVFTGWERLEVNDGTVGGNFSRLYRKAGMQSKAPKVSLN